MTIRLSICAFLCQLFFLLFSHTLLYGQHCYTTNDSLPAGTPAYRGAFAVCNGASPVYNDYFKKVENYRPFPLENSTTTTTKVIKVRAIVVNNSFYGPTAEYPSHYGTGSSDQEKIRNMMETWCNSNSDFSWQHMGTPSNARTEVCSTKCYIQDAKLRFKLVGINYVNANEDMSINGKSGSFYYHTSTYGAADKDSILNVFLVNYDIEGKPCKLTTRGGVTFYPNLFNIAGPLWSPAIIMYGSCNSESALYPTFMHEVAHTLGLKHTRFDMNECGTPAADFLYDVFGYNTSFCYYPDDTLGSCDPYLPENKNKCSNNLMGGKWMQQVYLSPLQMARIHRTAHLGNSSRFVYPLDPPEQNPWQITSDQKWDFGIRIYQDIIVKAGKTLTITCEVKMPPGSRIIVEKGAKLVIDGGMITAYHHKTSWKGIELYGDKNAAATPENQGSLIMQNEAMIEYATDGVRDFMQNSLTGGGIIQATNSIFKDCRRAVELNDYPNYNRGSSCSFTGVTFLTADAAAAMNQGRKDFPVFSAYNEREILIKDCIFKNTIPLSAPFFDMEQRNRAIYSEDAGFRIENCQFKGYKQAVNIGDHSNHPLRNVRVKNCSFDSVGTGIVFTDNFSYAQGNTFDHPINYVYTSGMQTYLHEGQAIYADNAGALTLTTNTVLNSGNNPNTRGITVNRSLATGARVIDNNISSARIGIITQNNNPALDILCNHFGGGGYNLVLNPASPNGLLKDQGNGCNALEYRAGNTFSSGTIKHIASYLNNTNWSYYYWGADPAQVPGNINGTFNNENCNIPGADGNSQCDLPGNVEQLVYRFKIGDLMEWIGQISPGELSSRQWTEFAAIVHYFNDTGDIAGLTAFLENVDHPEAKKLLPALYIDQQNQPALDAVLLNLNVSTAERAVLQTYYGLLYSLRQAGRSIYELDATELIQVRQIAADTFDISAKARGLLAFAYGEDWQHYQEQLPPMLSSGKVALNTAATKTSILYGAAPNPAQSIVRIELDLGPNDAINGRLVVRNMMGKIVQEHNLAAGRQLVEINVHSLPAGVYSYSLLGNGQVLQVKRLVVLK